LSISVKIDPIVLTTYAKIMQENYATIIV